MTSPVRPWFKLALQDEEAMQAPDAAAWLDDVTKRLQEILHRSNFYNNAHIRSTVTWEHLGKA